MQDLQYALRTLKQNPGFFFTAVLAVGLGIGANTAMFSIVDGVLLKPLPYDEPSRLVNIHELFPKRSAQGSTDEIPIPPADFIDYYENQEFFEKLAAYRNNPVSLVMPGADPERHFAVAVTEDYFDVLRIRPVFGRLFTKEEMQYGRDSVALISHGLWVERFGADPGVLSRKVELNGKPYDIIGVLPPTFNHPAKARLWIPATFSPAERLRRQTHTLYGIGRLKPGVSREQAEAQLQSILNRIGTEVPEMAKDKRVLVTSMIEDLTGKVRPALIALLGAVGFVLAIACANVANLLLARGATRQQEFAVRAALGAARGRLILQMLTESMLLSAAGGIFGLVLAYGGFFGLKLLAPANLPRLDQVAIDGRALLFTAGAVILTGILFGLIPALKMSRIDLNKTLKERGRSVSSGGRLRSVLVVAQVASAVILLSGAGLLTRSLYSLMHVDIGFDPSHLITMRVTPLPTKYSESVPAQIKLGRDILEKVNAMPGISEVGFTTDLPLQGNPRFVMHFEGFPPVTAASAPFADFFTVSPEYFKTMGIRLKQGRFFTAADDDRAPLVCIVNEQLVRTYFPGKNAVGRRLEIGMTDPPIWRTIVGVIADVRNVDLEKPAPVQLYGPYLQQPSVMPHIAPSLSIVARMAGDPEAMAEPIRRTILSADSSQPVYAVQTMEEVISSNLAHRKFSLFLMGVFAVLALVLAVIGLGGVVSYMVAQRTQEIGIRVALGAKILDVIWMVESHALKLVGMGVLVGIAGSLLISRALEAILFDVSPYDPVTLIGVVLTLVLIAGLAGYVPARRAARIDPVIALRQE